MPFLRLETTTPLQTDKVIQQQAEEIEELKKRIDEMEKRNKERFDKFYDVWKKNKAFMEALEKAEKERVRES